MFAIQKVFEMVYARDRRGHSHRCRCCWSVIKPGEAIVMLRLPTKTWALHKMCENNRHSLEYTWRQVFEVWGA